MDAGKFGAFIAAVRKEHGMTQAELARKLQVTDKAVSRWERGLGFPDIGTIEPLADALGLSVSELMRSEKNMTVDVTDEDASVGVINTLHVAKLQRKRMIRHLAVAVLLIVALIGCWTVGTGWMARADVYLGEWSVLPSGEAITVRVGIAGPMGYIRDCKDISTDPETVALRFYSAFGGLNSDMGARNVFVIPLNEECKEIRFERVKGSQSVLRKNEHTGEWELVRDGSGTAGDAIATEE